MEKVSREHNIEEKSIKKLKTTEELKTTKELKTTEELKSIEETETCPYCSGKHKDRNDNEIKDLMNRLKRIEGQVRGVEGMLENGAYCTDILMQVSAINSALNSFNKVLLANHINTCVAEDIRQGKEGAVDELVTILQKLMK